MKHAIFHSSIATQQPPVSLYVLSALQSTRVPLITKNHILSTLTFILSLSHLLIHLIIAKFATITSLFMRSFFGAEELKTNR